MNDLTTTIILSASGYVAFLVIGVACLIWYNKWNRKKMEINFSTDEASSARVEKPEARLESGTTSTQSLSESAIHDIYQGRRKSDQSALVEDKNKNNAGLTMAGRWLMQALRRRDSWER